MRPFHKNIAPAALIITCAVTLASLFASCQKEDFAEADFNYTLTELRQTATFVWTPSADGTLRCPDQTLSGVTVTSYNRVTLKAESDEPEFNGVAFSSSDESIVALASVGSDNCELVYKGDGNAVITMTAGSYRKSVKVSASKMVDLEGVLVTVGGREYLIGKGDSDEPNFVCVSEDGNVPAEGGEELVIKGLKPENSSFRYVYDFYGQNADSTMSLDDVNRKHYGDEAQSFCKNGHESQFDFSAIAGRKLYFDSEYIKRCVLTFEFEEKETRSVGNNHIGYYGELSYLSYPSWKPAPGTQLTFEDGSSWKEYRFLEYERVFEVLVSKALSGKLVLNVPMADAGWIEVKASPEDNPTSVFFHLSANDGVEERTSTISIGIEGGTDVVSVDISQIGKQSKESLYSILTEFRNATGGETTWKGGSEWGTDLQIFNWTGINSKFIKTGHKLFDINRKVYVGDRDLWHLGYGGGLDEFGITGVIPDSFWNACKYFYAIYLGENDLHESRFTSALWHDGLEEIYCPNTALGGTFDESMYKASNITYLNITRRQIDYVYTTNLDGEFPDLTRFPELTYLCLSGGTVTGELFPENIGDLKHLGYIYIGGFENLRGTIPDSFYDLKSLYNVVIHNTNMHGTISKKIANLENLGNISLMYNKFEGEIPEEIGTLPKMPQLFFWGNYFTNYPEFFRYRPCSKWGLDEYEWECCKNFPDDNLQHDKETGEVVNHFYYAEPSWIEVRFGVKSNKSRDMEKYPEFPYAPDLQYPATEYYWDGSEWRHPKYEHPAKEYWYNGTEWVHQPGNPWQTWQKSGYAETRENHPDWDLKGYMGGDTMGLTTYRVGYVD